MYSTNLVEGVLFPPGQQLPSPPNQRRNIEARATAAGNDYVTRTTMLSENGRARMGRNTYSSSQGQTSVEPLQLALPSCCCCWCLLVPESAAVTSAAPVTSSASSRRAARATGSMGAAAAAAVSAASAPQLFPRVGDTLGDPCTWRTNAVEMAPASPPPPGGDSLDDAGGRGSASRLLFWSPAASFSLSFGFEW